MVSLSFRESSVVRMCHGKTSWNVLRILPPELATPGYPEVPKLTLNSFPLPFLLSPSQLVSLFFHYT